MTWKRNTPNGFVSYLDGQLVAQRNSANIPLPNINAQVFFGTYIGWSEFTHGRLCDVRIWNRARTPEEINRSRQQRLTGRESGLIGYWPLDEGDGKTVADKTTQAHHGILQQASWEADDDLPFEDA